jgi:hypothetical protein
MAVVFPSCREHENARRVDESDSLLGLGTCSKLPLYSREIEDHRIAVRSVPVSYDRMFFIPSRMLGHRGGLS